MGVLGKERIRMGRFCGTAGRTYLTLEDEIVPGNHPAEMVGLKHLVSVLPLFLQNVVKLHNVSSLVSTKLLLNIVKQTYFKFFILV